MDLGLFFREFVVAAAVGALVGIEREHRGGESTVVIAGVRTFPLVAIAGFLIAYLAAETQSALVLAAGVAGAFGVGIMFIQMRVSVGQTGLTTPVAMVVTFLLGVVIGYGHEFEGVLVGIAATFLLVTKRRLHRFAHVLDDQEILSALQFITILFILLPLTATLAPGAVLGQSWVGRGALVDPFVILLVVVFVSSISFVSLVVMRIVGPGRGLEFSGILGGLVNSEATTASLAERAREETRLLQAAVAGALLASTMMLVRNLAIAAFTDTSLAVFVALLPFVAPMAAVGAAVSLISRSRHKEAIEVRMKNPFAVMPALRFAVIFAAASVLAALAQRSFGAAGVYVTSIGGFVSAGAVVASVANLYATGQVALAPAVRTALLATVASVVGKLFILRAVNPDAFRRALWPFAAMSAVAVVGALLSFAFNP